MSDQAMTTSATNNRPADPAVPRGERLRVLVDRMLRQRVFAVSALLVVLFGLSLFRS